MDKDYFIERIIKHTLDNKGKIEFLFLNNEEKMEKYFKKTMRIFRKKINEGYDVSVEYYLIDFYSYMMTCKGWNVLQLYGELFSSKRYDMAITKHLKEVNNELFSNYINDFLEKYNVGL